MTTLRKHSTPLGSKPPATTPVNVRARRQARLFPPQLLMIPRGSSLVTHKHLEAPAPATAAMGVTTTVDICPWATVHASLSIPWENSLVLATPNPLVEVTIAATGLGIIARTTDGGAVTAVVAASAMTVIVGMTARTPPPLQHLSLSVSMSCSFSD